MNKGSILTFSHFIIIITNSVKTVATCIFSASCYSTSYIFPAENTPHTCSTSWCFSFKYPPTGHALNQLHFYHHYSTKTCILTKVFVCNNLVEGLYGKYLWGKQLKLKFDIYMIVKSSSPLLLHLIHQTGSSLTGYPYKIITIVSRSLTKFITFSRLLCNLCINFVLQPQTLSPSSS